MMIEIITAKANLACNLGYFLDFAPQYVPFNLLDGDSVFRRRFSREQ
jgi:hypothetical protein